MNIVSKEEREFYRNLATRANGVFDAKFYEYCINRAHAAFNKKPQRFERIKIEPKTRQEIDIKTQRRNAVRFMLENYSREERHLLILERDLNNCKEAFENERFKSPEKREGKRWDFYAAYCSLIDRKNEFGWSDEFLLKNGIDFQAISRLIITLFTPQELAH